MVSAETFLIRQPPNNRQRESIRRVFHNLPQNPLQRFTGLPELASAEKGEKFFDGIVKEVSAFVEAFATWE